MDTVKEKSRHSRLLIEGISSFPTSEKKPFRHKAIDQHQQEDGNPEEGDTRAGAEVGVIGKGDAGDDRDHRENNGKHQGEFVGSFRLQSGRDRNGNQRGNDQGSDRFRGDRDDDGKKKRMGQADPIGLHALDLGLRFVIDGREDLRMEEEIEQKRESA